MFITPFMAAVLVGTFWSGVAASAVVNHDGWNGGWNRSSDINITASTSDHQAACAARYHSYQVDSDSWLGRDGRWHVCTL